MNVNAYVYLAPDARISAAWQNGNVRGWSEAGGFVSFADRDRPGESITVYLDANQMTELAGLMLEVVGRMGEAGGGLDGVRVESRPAQPKASLRERLRSFNRPWP